MLENLYTNNMTQEEFFKRYTYSPSRDRIGGGGFGTVYRAKDNLLHRTVAIKVSEVKTTADGQKTFSLKDEFEALNQVPKHPNIANYEEFYSFEMPNGIFDYAVMQFYPDGNLSNAIKHGLTDEQKEDIATQLLEGIAFLHQHKVVHRDLKPGNILIVKDDNRIIPLITDFGLSKAAGVVDGSVFSNSFGAGTPKYSSPEQLQGKPLRFNTDLWSYGAILYELFTGTQLFSAGSGAANTAQADLEVYNKIVNGDVRGLNKMPEKWRKVAERCLVVDNEQRVKSAAELHLIINGAADDDETELAKGQGNSGRTTRGDNPSSTPNRHGEPDLLSPKPQGGVSTNNNERTTGEATTRKTVDNASGKSQAKQHATLFEPAYRKMKPFEILAVIGLAVAALLLNAATLESSGLSLAYKILLRLPYGLFLILMILRNSGKEPPVMQTIITLSIVISYLAFMISVDSNNIESFLPLVGIGAFAEIGVFDFVTEKQKSLSWLVYFALWVMIVLWFVYDMDWRLTLIGSAIPVVALAGLWVLRIKMKR